MKIKASHQKHTLRFKFDAGTSRGILREKDSYFIIVKSLAQKAFLASVNAGHCLD